MARYIIMALFDDGSAGAFQEEAPTKYHAVVQFLDTGGMDTEDGTEGLSEDCVVGVALLDSPTGRLYEKASKLLHREELREMEDKKDRKGRG